MAEVTFTHIASGLFLQPGESHHWWWNNAPDERVWGFSVNPYAVWDGTKWGIAKAEITRVYELHHYTPGTSVSDPHEREIHVILKNSGDSALNYDLHMSSIRA
jgi:hypothetical protein